MNQIPNMFESLKIRIWILFVICKLVLGIFFIKKLNRAKIYQTTFITFLGDMTLSLISKFPGNICSRSDDLIL